MRISFKDYVLQDHTRLWNGTKNAKPLELGLAFSVGILSHIFFDIVLYPGVNVFWPTGWWYSLEGLYYPTLGLYERFPGKGNVEYAIVDMGIGVVWMAWLYVRNKLRF